MDKDLKNINTQLQAVINLELSVVRKRIGVSTLTEY